MCPKKILSSRQSCGDIFSKCTPCLQQFLAWESAPELVPIYVISLDEYSFSNYSITFYFFNLHKILASRTSHRKYSHSWTECCWKEASSQGGQRRVNGCRDWSGLALCKGSEGMLHAQAALQAPVVQGGCRERRWTGRAPLICGGKGSRENLPQLRDECVIWLVSITSFSSWLVRVLNLTLWSVQHPVPQSPLLTNILFHCTIQNKVLPLQLLQMWSCAFKLISALLNFKLVHRSMRQISKAKSLCAYLLTYFQGN